MKIYYLNIRQGGGKRVQLIVDKALSVNPDTIVFTEYRNNSNARQIESNLISNGYLFHTASSLAPLVNSICIFSKTPFLSTIFPKDLNSERHRALLAIFDGFSILCVYFPQRQEKKIFFDFIRSNIDSMLGENGVVIGDFNTGNNDLDTQGVKFYCATEFDEVCDKYLVDSWRTRNKKQEFTWYSKIGNGFRIDHVLSTPPFDKRIHSIEYSHEERISGISDHSSIILAFN